MFIFFFFLPQVDAESLYYDRRVGWSRYQGRRQVLQDALVALTPKLEATCEHVSTPAGIVVNLHRYRSSSQLPLALVQQIQYDLATYRDLPVNLVFLASLVAQRCHSINNDKRLKFGAAANEMPPLVRVERPQQPAQDGSDTESDSEASNHRKRRAKDVCVKLEEPDAKRIALAH
jgi:hypothetical protein